MYLVHGGQQLMYAGQTKVGEEQFAAYGTDSLGDHQTKLDVISRDQRAVFPWVYWLVTVETHGFVPAFHPRKLGDGPGGVERAVACLESLFSHPLHSTPLSGTISSFESMVGVFVCLNARQPSAQLG